MFELGQPIRSWLTMFLLLIRYVPSSRQWLGQRLSSVIETVG